MKSFYRLLLPFFILSFFSSGLFAAETQFNVQREPKIFNQSKEKALATILDFEHICESGCRHYVSNVEFFEVLKRDAQNKNPLLIWQSVKGSMGFGDSQVFQKVTIAQDGKKTLVKISYPSDEEVSVLEGTYQRESKTLFSTMEITWTIEELAKDQVQVSYDLEATSSKFIIRASSGKVQSAMEQTADELLATLED